MIYFRRGAIGMSVSLVVLLLLSTQSFGVSKDELAGLREEIEQKNKEVQVIQEKIERYKKTINQKRLERVSLNNQVSLIENRIEKAALDIESTDIQLEQTGLEIQTIEFAVEERAKQIAQQRGTITDFIKLIHSNDQKSNVEILAGYTTLSDFFADVQYTKTLHNGLADTTQRLKLAKAELESEKEQQELKKETLQQLAESLDAKRVDLDSQKFLKEDLIEQVASSEQKFTSLVTNLRQQYEAIESDIVSIERQIRQKLEESDSFAGTGELILDWPVPSRYITAYFHDPDYPYRHVFEHSGLDMRAPQGTAIRAAGPGFVARAKKCSSHLCFGYTLIVHRDQVSTLYGHMSRIDVNEGDFVARGDIIGLSGGTPGTVGAGPFVTGPHLHFETRVNGIPVNPLNYLQ